MCFCCKITKQVFTMTNLQAKLVSDVVYFNFIWVCFISPTIYNRDTNEEY